MPAHRDPDVQGHRLQHDSYAQPDGPREPARGSHPIARVRAAGGVRLPRPPPLLPVLAVRADVHRAGLHPHPRLPGHVRAGPAQVLPDYGAVQLQVARLPGLPETPQQERPQLSVHGGAQQRLGRAHPGLGPVPAAVPAAAAPQHAGAPAEGRGPRARRLRQPGQVPPRGEERVVRAALHARRGRVLEPRGQALRRGLAGHLGGAVLLLQRLHRAHLPHRPGPLPLPRAPHHLPLHVLLRLLRGLPHPPLRRRREHRLRPGQRPALCHPGGTGEHRLHAGLPGPLLLRHGQLAVVGGAHAHLVPGRRQEVGPRGHRSQQQLLPPGSLGHPGGEDHPDPGHAQGGGGRAHRGLLRGQHGRQRAHRLRAHSPGLLPGHRHVLHPLGLRGPVPHPEGDEDGRREHGQAGEAHGAYRALLRAVHRAGHLCDRLLLLRTPQHGLLEDPGGAAQVQNEQPD
ncbi:FZD10 isoform 1 [Pan troglodytes]|uniref:FZD10 isoform 1 n=1 Tax=Pan troglodytes TaxID=9598 RepID=A0A2J8MCG7_PANTR|nr:FZD10 isoform 1 [Pan troglodytes]